MKDEDPWMIHGIMVNGEAVRKVWVGDVVREYSSDFLGHHFVIVIRPDDEDKLNRLW